MDMDELAEAKMASNEEDDEDDPLWNDVNVEELKTEVPGSQAPKVIANDKPEYNKAS